jgi:polyhydroxyalkanoate synthesis repressor PhaR
MSDKVRLKKYSNRRLYDTEKSTYVTIHEVAEMVRRGRQVEVIDAHTKEDVTSLILTQIILEEAKKKTTLLPASLLYLIIRYGNTVLSEFFEKYLEQTVNNYLVYKSTVDEQFKKWLELGVDMSTMAQKTMEGLTPFPGFRNFWGGAAPPTEKEKPKK